MKIGCQSVIPVIISGGAGSRLWPLSPEAHPKPFIKLAGEQSLLQKIFIRAGTAPQVEEILRETSLKAYLFKILGLKCKKPLPNVHALKNVHLEIKAGERVGSIGHNGAGDADFLAKSKRCINDLIQNNIENAIDCDQNVMKIGK